MHNPSEPFDSDSLAEMFLPRPEYRGVSMLNSAADFCSGVCLAMAAKGDTDSAHWAQASAELGLMADQLDRELIEKVVA
jgi:hypothetical protein